VLNAIPATAGSVSDSYIVDVSASKLTGSRTIPKGTMPAGSVLQVVSSVFTTNFTTASATFVTTGASVSITPTSASSKIAVFVLGGHMNTDASGKQGFLTLYRGASNIGAASGMVQFYSQSGGNMQSNSTFGTYDDPATTSSTTYTVYMKTNTNSMTWNNDSNEITLLAMEIAA
jgi:hypothetical protein